MLTSDVLIIGGGPAGSSCAWKLHKAGLKVLVLDKAVFPREKLCAGWITPRVMEQLQIDPDEYGRGRVLQPFAAFRTGLIGGPQIQTDYARPVSYGMRRAELDCYLLERCGADLELGQPAETIRRDDGQWVVNERFRSPVIVGAGGHFCPVARLLGNGSREEVTLFATQEIEFPLADEQAARCPVDPGVPELYFCEDLLGYGWCVRKGPVLNVGLGREDRRGLPRHVARFREFLRREGRIPQDTPERFHGHVYLSYDASRRPLVEDGVLLVGDAAGMAYAASGEGIGPAVESGLMAASAILAAGGHYDRVRLGLYERLVHQRFGRRRGSAAGRAPSRWRQALGRRLLRSRWFVRHVVLDRWFLRTGRMAALRV